MSLGGALQIGRTGLLASQAAIEVTGNNLANVATRGYHRQTISLAPVGDSRVQGDIFIGRGVQIQAIQRQVNEAIETRLRGSIADEAAAAVRQDILTEIESIQNELSDNGLSNYLGEFFNAWSELANSPNDNSVRTVVMQQAQTVVNYLRSLRSSLSDVRARVDNDISAAVSNANDLLSRIERLNMQIAAQDGGSGGASGLRDQRDQLLAELSQYMDVSVVEQPSGSVDVFVGSLPVILDGRSRGLSVNRYSVNGELRTDIVLGTDGSLLVPRSGSLGALIASRSQDVGAVIAAVDTFASQLIYQVNRVHTQGQGITGFSTLTGTYKAADVNAALNSAAAGLTFAPRHGSFEVTVTQKSTGAMVTRTIQVDLDGIDPQNDTSLASLIASLNGVPNLTASATADGRLRLDSASADFEVSFGTDTSGVLAALGVNTFFTGGNGTDIAVNGLIAANPARIAASQGNIPGDNRNALAVAELRTKPLADLNGQSITRLWNRHVGDFAVRLGQARQSVDASILIRENLQQQQQVVSGVNTDEEAINLLAFQRAYQGSARFLTVVDEMYQTLLSIL